MTFISDFISLFYPLKCAACDKALYLHEVEICNSCFLSLPKTDYHNQRGNRVEQIFWGRIQIHSAASFWFFHKGSRVQRVLHNLKYNGRTGVGHVAGEWFGNALKIETSFSTCDFIIPVPLHQKRQIKRGYNQSQCIADGLSKALSIPVKNNFLVRPEYSSTQTKEAKFSRWEKAQNLFLCPDLNPLKNKHVLLVDDVITTGATLEACCLALQKAEGIKISIVSLAYAE
jgi:ComF family protein